MVDKAMQETKNSVLTRFPLIAAGLAAGWIWYAISYYHTPGAPIGESLNFVFISVVAAMLFIIPCYTAMYCLLPFARKGWGAFLAGVLWPALCSANPFMWIMPDTPPPVAYLLYYLFGPILTSAGTCLTVAGMLWLVEKRRTCASAAISLVLGVFALGLLIVLGFTGTTARHTHIELIPLPLLGLALGAIAPLQIRKAKGQRTGYALAVSGIIINTLLCVGLAADYWSEYRWRTLGPRLNCAANMRSLAMTMIVYASDDEQGRFPTADRWCDLLLKDNRAEDDQFVCREAAKRGGNPRCNYAINPNARSSSPPDTVLLFETKGGWSQHGGAEILTTENHRGKGCNIVFNDTSVKFVPTNELSQLKWKAEAETP
jgi:hypothetical protein